MKKIFSLIFICLISIFAFAGCGVKGGSMAMGVEFVKDVFYVDYNVNTFLDYKVYPITADNVYVNFEVENDLSIEKYFSFKDGYVKVVNKRFTSIKVTAKLNEHTDVCEVKLKEYPQSISFNETVDYVNAGSVYPINLQGVFDDGVKTCKDQQFNFKLESSNPSIIEVLSEDDLLVRSTGRRGQAELTVKILDASNQEKSGLEATMTLKVVENINTAFITLGNETLKNNDVLNLELSSSEEKRIKALYFDEYNVLNKMTSYTVYLSNDYLFDLKQDSNGYYLKVKELEPLPDGMYYSVKLTIQSEAVDSAGNPHKIDVQINVQILES